MSSPLNSPLDLKALWKLLPHRYPFLLVDRILELDLEAGVIVGQKNVTINEQFFQGHFPDAPIMPGVLVLEALAQTGGVLVHLKDSQKERIALLLNVTEAKFRCPVVPGDVLTLRCELLHFGSRGGRVKARASVGEKTAVDAEVGFVLVPQDQVGSI
jgi:3-hydroxyacyl-[acyl-carrier-protein] dehydratase